MFESKLGEIGADFPTTFVKNLDRLIVTMHPKYKRKAAKLKAAKAKANGTDSKAVSSLDIDIKARKFPGLAMPDSEWRPLDDYLDERKGKEPAVDKLPDSISMDSTMAELAAVASRRNRPAAEDYIDGEPANKRSRGGYERDNGYGSRNGGGGREVDGGYGARLGAPRGRSGPDGMDERPVLYKIYAGNVTNVRDFGAFVGLEGIRGRVEGRLAFLRPAKEKLTCHRSHTCFKPQWTTRQLGSRRDQAQRAGQSQGDDYCGDKDRAQSQGCGPEDWSRLVVCCSSSLYIPRAQLQAAPSRTVRRGESSRGTTCCHGCGNGQQFDTTDSCRGAASRDERQTTVESRAIRN